MDVLGAAALLLPISLVSGTSGFRRWRWRLAFPGLLLALAVTLRLSQGLTTWNLLLAFWSLALATGWVASSLRDPIMRLFAIKSGWPSPVTDLRDQWAVNSFRLATFAAALGPVVLVYWAWGGDFDLVRLGWGNWLREDKLFGLEAGGAYLTFVIVIAAAAAVFSFRLAGPRTLRILAHGLVAGVLAWGWWGNGNWLVFFFLFQAVGVLPVALFAAPWRTNHLNRRFWAIAPSTLVFALPNGFLEEVLFRGFLFGLLVPLVGLPWALALSSLSFGLLHWYGGAPSGFAGALLTSVGGAIFALSVDGTGGLWWAILTHAETDVGVALAQMDTRDPSEQEALPWPARPDAETFQAKVVTTAQ